MREGPSDSVRPNQGCLSSPLCRPLLWNGDLILEGMSPASSGSEPAVASQEQQQFWFQGCSGDLEVASIFVYGALLTSAGRRRRLFTQGHVCHFLFLVRIVSINIWHWPCHKKKRKKYIPDVSRNPIST